MEALSKVALVTGATGFIGGRLAERLIEEGWAVRLLVRDAAKLAAPLRGADIVIGDLADKMALNRAVEGVSVIFHCAANVSTWDTKDAYYAANVLGVTNLLEAIALKAPGILRFVHISTVDVYGFPEKPCDEQAPTAPTGFGYGDSKRLGEKAVQGFCAHHGIAYTIIRPANVIGPKSQFILRIGQELQSGIMLTIDKGSTNAGITYIDNLIAYIIWASRAPKAAGQCYNVRDAYDVSWSEFITIFRKQLRGWGFVIDLPFGMADMLSRLIEAFYRVCLPSREPLLHPLMIRLFGRTCGHSAAKIRSDSGVKEQIGFDEAMARSAQWFLEER